MRILLIMRGAPGAGKTTWIDKHGLKPYTISPDDLRVLCASRDMQADGKFSVACDVNVDKKVWDIVFNILEYRMSRGELTVIDGTASKTKDIQRYKDLADKYRYRKYVVDLTNVPLETCLAQNKMRHEDKIVPEEVIHKIYARFATQPVPSGVEVIQPDEFEKVLDKPIDLSSYRKLVFVGDIHGCYDTLMQYPDFKDGLKDDTEYIFLGDYIDRGNQNVEVLNYLQSIMNKPNVCLLTGNHENSLWSYGENEVSYSRRFETKTKPELIEGGYSQKSARMLYRKLRQMSHLMWNGLEILACHGGIPSMRVNLAYMPAAAFIRGVGEYNDYTTIANTWMGQTKENQYLIHGHRNTQSDPTQIADRVYNLEGEVEFGGKLRIVELENVDGEAKWNMVEIENCQPILEGEETESYKPTTVEETITLLRNNQYIKEKELGSGISSFNFTREAFYRANWTKQTILARGLFLDTVNNQVAFRSYDKFFAVNETHATDLTTLKTTLSFPVNAYVKENGFLGLVAYDYNHDDLFISSKTTTDGEFAGYMKEAIEPYREKLLYWFRGRERWDDIGRVTFVFECINPEKDPHIIKYNESKVVLLDVIYNDLEFRTVSYRDLKAIANIMEMPVKRLAYTIKNWEEFEELYNATQSFDYHFNGDYIEGFVFVDAKNFMVKAKTGYYKFWKGMRGVADSTLKQGYYFKTGSLDTALANYFYGFCRKCYQNDYDKETKSYPYATDIISLREKFLETLQS